MRRSDRQNAQASFPRRFEGRTVLVTGAQWTKLIFNSAASPVAALTGLTMGQLGEAPGARDLIGGLAAEGCAVAGALGISLDDDPLAMIEEAVTHAHGHRPSML